LAAGNQDDTLSIPVFHVEFYQILYCSRSSVVTEVTFTWMLAILVRGMEVVAALVCLDGPCKSECWITKDFYAWWVLKLRLPPAAYFALYKVSLLCYVPHVSFLNGGFRFINQVIISGMIKVLRKTKLSFVTKW